MKKYNVESEAITTAAKFVFSRPADMRGKTERELDECFAALDEFQSAYTNYYAAELRGDVSGWMTPDEIAAEEDAVRKRIAELEL